MRTLRFVHARRYVRWLWRMTVLISFVCIQRACERRVPPATLQEAAFVIFSVPKGPTVTSTQVNEELALISWTLLLEPAADYVIILGNGTKLSQLAKTYDKAARARLQPTRVIFKQLQEHHLVRTLDGDSLPDVRAVFDLAESIIPSEHRHPQGLFAYVNGDIILPTDFVNVARKILNPRFSFYGNGIISGSRIDCTGPNVNKLKSFVLQRRFTFADIVLSCNKSAFHAPTGKDFFVYNSGFWTKHGGIPHFALARTAFDDYLAAIANHFGQFVDVSPILNILHLPHDYSHSIHVNKKALWKSQAARVNRELMESQCIKYFGGKCHGTNLNEAKWRACPTRISGNLIKDFGVFSAREWSYDDSWQQRRDLHGVSKDKCEESRSLFACQNDCDK